MGETDVAEDRLRAFHRTIVQSSRDGYTPLRTTTLQIFASVGGEDAIYVSGQLQSGSAPHGSAKGRLVIFTTTRVAVVDLDDAPDGAVGVPSVQGAVGITVIPRGSLRRVDVKFPKQSANTGPRFRSDEPDWDWHTEVHLTYAPREDPIVLVEGHSREPLSVFYSSLIEDLAPGAV